MQLISKSGNKNTEFIQDEPNTWLDTGKNSFTPRLEPRMLNAFTKAKWRRIITKDTNKPKDTAYYCWKLGQGFKSFGQQPNFLQLWERK